MTEPLHLKYRPKTFDEVRGIENKRLVEGILLGIDRVHFYILSGPAGCGKTTIARLIGKELKVDDKAIKEINAADKTGIDYARYIISQTSYHSLYGDKKMYILDECHRLTSQAFDALLKTLEEPPKHCYFVFCTTALENIPDTIKSRAHIYQVKPLDYKEAIRFILWVCKEEGIVISDRAFDMIIEQYGCIPRDMLIALDRIRDAKDEETAINLISKVDHPAGPRRRLEKHEMPFVEDEAEK